MKFSFTSLLAVSGLVGYIHAETPEQVDTPAVPQLKIDVEYTIIEFPDIKNTDVLEVSNEKEFTFDYKITNGEANNITVVGFGGSIIDPTTGETKANLTSAAVGPFAIDPLETGAIKQKISMNLVTGGYALIPSLFVIYEGELKVLQPRGQLVYIFEEPVSIFNPQLLFLEAILIATFGAALYVAYNIWGKEYFSKPSSAAFSKKKASSASPGPSGKSYDSEWIPETHLKQKRVAKSKQ